jgi:hypothetical protein
MTSEQASSSDRGAGVIGAGVIGAGVIGAGETGAGVIGAGVGDSVCGSEASLLGCCDGWELGKPLGPGDSSIGELAATTASELVK